MEFIEKVIEMRLITMVEIIDYFIKLDGKRIEYGKVIGDGWKVEVKEESPINLGSIRLPVITIVFNFRKDLFDTMYYDFCLKFSRGGG
ncbi:hypothetical protein [Clostridium sp. DL1XJH146]